MSRWITHGGKTLTAAGWARATGKNPSTILHQLDAGHTPAEVLSAPLDGEHSRAITPHQRDELARRYSEEKARAVDALSAEWRVSKSTLYRELAVAGVPARAQLSPEALEDARRRILLGASMRSEAKRLEVNASTLSRALAKRAEIR